MDLNEDDNPHTPGTLMPSASSLEPAACVASQLDVVTSFPMASCATTPPEESPLPGGTKNAMYGTANPKTFTPSDENRIRFIAWRRDMSGTKESSAADMRIGLEAATALCGSRGRRGHTMKKDK